VKTYVSSESFAKHKYTYIQNIYTAIYQKTHTLHRTNFLYIIPKYLYIL